MGDLPSTIVLALLTCAAAAGTASAIASRFRPEPRHPGLGLAGVAWGCALGSALLLLYRWLAVYHEWQPLRAHVDGLLLLASLTAVLLEYLQYRCRLPGLRLFLLPALLFLLAWALCASRWTFHLFDMASVWNAVHLVGVYLGLLCAVLAAAAGTMFLLVDALLRRRRDPAEVRRVGNLETLERLMVRTATLSFALLGLGVVTGLLILQAHHADADPGWWRHPKVLLGVAGWVTYGVLMNARYAARFRGARAALLSLVGLALLLTTLAVAVHAARAEAAPASQPAPVQERH